MTQVSTHTRHLPDIPRKAELVGYRLLRTLDRMGFTHKNRDGTIFSVRFSDAVLLGQSLAIFEVDVARLWHYSIGDLTTQRVIKRISTVLGKAVQPNYHGGLSYVVRLSDNGQEEKRGTPPTTVGIDLDSLPLEQLAIPIGKNAQDVFVERLPILGHSLICGTTGSGKSSWLHSALAALLSKNGKDDLRVVLVDPKRSELNAWRSAPHLLAPIAYTSEQATNAVASVVDEIDKRGDTFANAGVRDIKAYNKRCGKLPYVLVVVDEALDLLLDCKASDPLLQHLKTIACRGRSAGVVLWIATQHSASISGLPRVLNINLSTRLVFRVQDASAARVAGCPGAESLPRSSPGRFLARIDGAPVELQGFYLSDAAISKIAQSLPNNSDTHSVTNKEMIMVRYAIDNLGGQFPVNKIASVFDLSNRQVGNLARNWEMLGLLLPAPSRNESRKVSPTLIELARDT